LQKTYLLQH